MTSRLIPERTVDSLLAAEIAMFLPTSLIWSPSNTRGQLDHQVFMPGARVLSLECKGVVSNRARDPSARWKAPIDYPQLRAYCAGPLPIHYIIPAKPKEPKLPWIRPCIDAGDNGWCAACSNSGPAARRRWAGNDPWVKVAPIHWRFQPWFAHWCWVIPANVLAAHLQANADPHGLSCADADLEVIQNAERLCHFLTKLACNKINLNTASLPSETFLSLFSEWLRFDYMESGDIWERTDLQFVCLPNQELAAGC